MKRDRVTLPVRRLSLLIAIGLAFIIGFAAGAAAQDKPLFRTEVVAARERLDLHVRPDVMMPMTSDDIRIEARLARHPDHRQLAITWDGGAAGGGSSVRTLDGDAEPYLFVRTLRNQPAATWRFVAEVYDDRGKVVARDAAEIRMPEVTEQ